MRLVFAGTPEAAVPSLEALLASEHEVAAVVTRPDAVAGRGRRVSVSPVAQRAADAGIEVLKPAKADDPGFLDRLRGLEPDCCPVVAYGALLRQEALDIPRHGWINLHFSLLPAWRGAAPVQHAILHGDDITGAATFRIEPALDSGPVYGVVTEPIGPTDTSGDLLGRLAASGAGLLVRTLDGIAKGDLDPRPQSPDGLSYAAKLNPEDARVDFSAPAMRVDRLVRACTPAPGAWTVFRGARLKLGPVRPVSDAPALPPGRLEVGKKHVLVGTATHPVRLGDVQPQGKRPMPAVDWARGVRPAPDESLGRED
ncbi:methionyl-tRNA formyltransferase [Actinorugispora endophytica]|uniref:Methionyl-tRNA formyltransferase n=1 Tax=Actinorugispora endophytica TaxID=1605990 RepID=A0A4R6UYH9_9ACTN|nr:methionyl-tRNA formyltransferase [Actinorugispora endophytica]TDQ52562.1 methionyl-tRNA formyltransferase [Actinorugispora endophytica]